VLIIPSSTTDTSERTSPVMSATANNSNSDTIASNMSANNTAPAPARTAAAVVTTSHLTTPAYAASINSDMTASDTPASAAPVASNSTADSMSAATAAPAATAVPAVVTVSATTHINDNGSMKSWKTMDSKEKESFLNQCTLDDIGFDAQKTEIISIKSVEIKSILINDLRKFASANKVTIGPIRTREKVLNAIVQHCNGAVARNIMKSQNLKKKKDKKTIPKFVTSDATYIRVNLTILSPRCKDAYKRTGQAFNRGELDSRNGKRASWAAVHAVYNDLNDDTLSLLGEEQYQSHYTIKGIHDGMLCEFDVLSLDEFIEVCQYINAKYDEARKKRDTSGHHADFPNYVAGKVWLIHYWARMMELGDEMYAHMASVELSKDVMIVSDAGGNLTTPVRPPASVAKGSKEKKELLANLQTKRANLAQSGQVRNDKISEAIVRNNRDNAFERLHKVIHQDEQLHAEKDQYEMEMSEIGNEPSGEDLLRLKRLKRKHAGVEERLVLNKRHKAYLEKETTCTDKALF